MNRSAADLPEQSDRCPSRQELLDFNIGNLTAVALDEIATHIESCDACQKTIDSIWRRSDDLVDSVREDANSSPGDGDTDEAQVAEVVAAINRLPAVLRGASAETSDPETRRLREYVLLDELGEGGMGKVYAAKHTRLDRTVAVKVLSSQRLKDARAIERFDREMKAVGALDHPNIVRALDAGEVDGTHFLAMELVEGITLSELVEQRGPLPVDEACELIRQAAVGLQHIHEHGLVHRDIKPSNLMLDQKERVSDGKGETDAEGSNSPAQNRSAPVVKLLDLGLALLDCERPLQGRSSDTVDDEASLTVDGQVMGTPDYIAPEQASGSRAVDIRADIYCLGGTLYFLLAGRPPFSALSRVEKLRAHETGTPQPIRGLRDDVPAEVEQLLAKMMAKRPGDRFQTPLEVVEALDRLSKNGDSGINGNAESSRDSLSSTIHRVIPVHWLVIALIFGVGSVVVQQTVKHQRNQQRAQVTPPRQEPPAIPAPELKTDDKEERPGTPPNPEAFDWQPSQLTAVLGTHRGKHWGSVTCGVSSADGAFVATGGRDKLVRLWDPKTMEERAVLRGQTRSILAMALSPDARWLATGGLDGDVIVWDNAADDAKRVFFYEGFSAVTAAAYSQDGKRLAIGKANGAIILFASRDGQLEELVEVDSDQPAVNSLVFDSTGSRLFSSGKHKDVLVWGVNGDELQRQGVLTGHDRDVISMALSPDGQMLATGGVDTTIRLWNAKDLTRHPYTLQQDAADEIASLTFSADGKTLASGSWDGKVYLWRVDGREAPLIAKIQQPAPLINAVTFIDQHRLLTGDKEGAVRIWDISGDEPTQLLADDGHQGAVESLVLSRDGKTLVSASADNRVCVWDVSSATPQRRLALTTLSSRLTSAAVSPDSQTLAIAGHREHRYTIDLWNLSADEPSLERTLDGHQRTINSLAFSPNGRTLASASGDGTARLWPLGDRQADQSVVINAGKTSLSGVAFSPDGEQLALTGGNGLLELIDLPINGQPEGRIRVNHQRKLGGVFYSPNGRYVAVCAEGQTRVVWRFVQGEPKQFEYYLPRPKHRVWSRSASHRGFGTMAFSPKSEFLAYSVGGNIFSFHLNTRTYQTPVELPGEAFSLVFAADGKHLFTGNANGTIYKLKMSD